MKILLIDIEDFRDIPNHPDYKVDKIGRVLSFKCGKTRQLKCWINSSGYYTYKIDNAHYPLHRILANTFIPRLEQNVEVNHIDGNKRNNDIANLEWITKKDNLLHAMRTGLHANPETPVIGTHIRTGERYFFCSQAEAARQTPAKQSNISKCLDNLRQSAGGYLWEFQNI